MDRLLAAVLLALLPVFQAFPAELRAQQDAWIDGAADVRDANNGTSRTVRTRNPGPRIGLIRFTGLPPSFTAPATLNLRVETVNRPGVVQVRLVQGQWSENTVTFNSRPPIASAILDSRTITAADIGRTLSFNVSSAVANWISNPNGNFGLAITATGTTAEVYFVSREGGVPPVLTVNTTPSDNEVTVARSGGDYTDPVVAAGNAFQGDTWCVNPSESAPCRMRIGAGIFILSRTLEVPRFVAVIGAGRKATKLVADNGVEPAVMSSSVLLSDLGIFNAQEGRTTALFMINATSAETIDSRLERVEITALGRETIAVENFFNHVQMTDSVLTSVGTVAAAVFPMIEGSELEATRSSLVCRSESSCAGASADTGGIVLRNSTVVANGGTTATGLIGTSTAFVLVDSTVSVASAGTATGLLAHDFGGSASLSSSQVTAEGGSQATGISWFGGELNVDESLVTGTSVAVKQAESSLTSISIRGSTLAGETVLSELNDAGDPTPLPVLIERSFLRGTVTIGSQGGARYTVSNSVLAGQRTFNGSVATCTEVYDANYDRLGASCQ